MSLKSILPFVQLFSGPLGNLINTGIATGSGAFVAWQISKGIPADAASNIALGLVTIISAGVNMLTGTQLVKINDVRANPNNGVTVVSAADAARARITRVNEPNPQNMG